MGNESRFFRWFLASTSALHAVHATQVATARALCFRFLRLYPICAGAPFRGGYAQTLDSSGMNAKPALARVYVKRLFFITQEHSPKATLKIRDRENGAGL